MAEVNPTSQRVTAARSKAARLTFFGEYLPPGPDNEEIYRARLLLIETTKRCVPQFLQELSASVFPLYKELAESGYDFDRIVWGPSAYELLPEEGIKQALADWAARFNASKPTGYWLQHSVQCVTGASLPNFGNG
jgi:hypothetical protein